VRKSRVAVPSCVLTRVPLFWRRQVCQFGGGVRVSMEARWVEVLNAVTVTVDADETGATSLNTYYQQWLQT